MKRFFSLWRRTTAWMVLLAIIISFTGYGEWIIDSIKDTMEYDVTPEPIYIVETGFHPGNHFQRETCPIDLFVWNNTLYASFSDSNGKPQYRKTLCQIKDGMLVPVKNYSREVIGESNGYVYFWELSKMDPYDQNDRIMHLSCLDLRENHFYWLPSVEVSPLYFDVVDENGLLYMMDGDFPEKHFILKDGRILDSVQTDFYRLGENRYYINEYYGRLDLIRQSPAGDEETIKYGHLWEMFFYPCENGLLVHKTFGTELLSYIPEDTQEPVPLLECLPYAYCVANVHNGYVYVSMERRAGWNAFREQSFRTKDETFFGTYRISLEDYSMERLSDEVYRGLYIFDDTGIYAVQDSRVCKLDFDGNEIMTILE